MVLTANDAAKESFSITLQHIVKVVRIAYLIVAIVFVANGLYLTLRKVKQQNVNVRFGINHISKVKFPSVTFCYKYKHGGKDAILAYRDQLFEKWKESGNFKRNCRNTMAHIINIIQV